MVLKLIGSVISLFLIGSSNYMLYNLMTGGEVDALVAITNYVVAAISFFMGVTILFILYLTSPGWRRDLILTLTLLTASIFEFLPIVYTALEDIAIVINWAPQTALNLMFGLGFLYMAFRKAKPKPVSVEIMC